MVQNKNSLPLHFSNQEYVLQILEEYEKDPANVSPDWRAFFQGMEFASSGGKEKGSLKVGYALFAYRRFGHLEAKHNPMMINEKVPALSLSALGFSEEDLQRPVATLGIVEGDTAPLQQVLDRLRDAFTGSLSFEYDHIEKEEIRSFLDREVLRPFTRPSEDMRFVAEELYRAKRFEDFLQKKFLGAKRFSLEGCEMFIPMMKELFALAGEGKIESVVMGMAHRGRLNVLCNLLGKPYSALMQEFDAKKLPLYPHTLGDVKYHKGYSSLLETRFGKKLRVTLSSNPSHLESVDPVVLGIVRAKSRLPKNEGGVLPLIIHGDASVAGQGIVYESLQMNALEGYGVQGTIHIVLNNQVGFTTVPEESRSTRYCTDIAKTFGMPIMHVNAEDPVAVLRAVRIAFSLRQQFGIDVFIDLNGHRFWGHNETDEPMFTNPKLYRKIKSKENIYQEFSQKLVAEGIFSKASLEEMEKRFDATLEKAYQERESFQEESKVSRALHKVGREEVLSVAYLQKLGHKVVKIPEAFAVHPKVLKLFEGRQLALSKGENIDWATAEMLAYATLLEQGISIRISGQDVRRGTFSHRHAVLYSQEKEEIYTPLSVLVNEKTFFEIYNSPLSEMAVMGYEFGYTLGNAEALVVWEAQYGDFVNGAQTIIDQYLAGSETKWETVSTLTLLLPHGFEGGGPEHSSCRFERFLQLSGLENWRVAYPSTPAQLFHLLRRQVLHPEKKPLILVTPKSMLRLSSSFSKLTDCTGSFQEILFEGIDKPKLSRVLLCTGKIYYELPKREDMAILRLEELYPFPRQLQEIVDRLRHAKEFVWVQEEPSNQGAWEYLQPQLQAIIGAKIPLRYIGRPRSSIPDTGYYALYEREQKRIIAEATGG